MHTRRMIVLLTYLVCLCAGCAARGCASVPLMQQEQQVQRALLAVHSYRMASERLELTYDDGKIMQWTKP